MSGEEPTLWDYDRHTGAKHGLLVGYLHAWFPIMASNAKAINIIDGFAGPGRYRGGEPGSPLLMIDAFVNHGRRTDAMDSIEVHFDFIEQRSDRIEHLRREIDDLDLPDNVQVELHHGSFEDVMPGLLDAIPDSMMLAPTFAFIDPFGYTGHGLELSSRILQSKKCETLIYVPLPHIARFVGEASVEPALDNLYGDSSWRAARAEKGKAAQAILHDVFLGQVRKAAGHCISFEVEATQARGWTGYTLYFGTGSVTGLDRMKEAMWKVDPETGGRFAFSVDLNLLTLFGLEPDLRLLETSLRERFGLQPFTIEEATIHTIVETPYASRIHLKKRTLAVAEAAGRISADHPAKPNRRRGTYPPGTIMRFTEPDA